MRFTAILTTFFLAFHELKVAAARIRNTNTADARGLQSEGTSVGGGFDQSTIVTKADELYCTRGEYVQEYVIDVTLDQAPIDVPADKQCASACDCEMRCCSNYPYYITYESAYGKEGILGGGGVCLEIPDSITSAAEDSCAFGLANIEATKPPTAMPVTKPDDVEMSMRRLELDNAWLDQIAFTDETADFGIVDNESAMPHLGGLNKLVKKRRMRIRRGRN